MSLSTRSDRISLRNFVIIGVQLGLVLLMLRQYQIEGAAFVRLAAFAFCGFAIHALLPLRHRLPFFAALSLAGTALVLGMANAAWLVGIGLVLIGICHLPIAAWIRGTLLVLAAGTLALQRATLLPFPWSAAIWPMLGSMFMFRLIVYLYDLRHEKAPPFHRADARLLLPAAERRASRCFRSSTTRRSGATTTERDSYRIYQRGIDWMVRGAVSAASLPHRLLQPGHRPDPR